MASNVETAFVGNIPLVLPHESLLVALADIKVEAFEFNEADDSIFVTVGSVKPRHRLAYGERHTKTLKTVTELALVQCSRLVPIGVVERSACNTPPIAQHLRLLVTRALVLLHVRG
jgi:hypothetical protein